MNALMNILMLLLAIALVPALLRVWRGPGLADRLVALDVCAVVAISTTVLHAMRTHQPILLDLAIALAVVAFVGTVAFARYLEKEPRHDDG